MAKESYILERARSLASLMGSLFGGKRDLYEVFGYAKEISYEQKLIKYMRQDIAGRIVDAPATALWTNPPSVSSSDAAWTTAWNDLVTRNKLWYHIEAADKLAGIGKFAVILIGFNDGGSLDSPVNTRSLKQKTDNRILFMQAYGQNSVGIDTLDNDIRSENFGQPLMYKIKPIVEADLNIGGTASIKYGKEFKVHASRIIHVVDNTLDNTIYGYPRLERVYNLLDDLIKVTGGSAETFWLTANRGLHIDVDKEMELDKDDEKNLSDEVAEYVHQLTRVIRTRGTKVSSLGSDVPDPRGTYDIIISNISGATGIPRRILTGSEAGQLASAQDRANWADRIEERRADWANPIVIAQIISKMTNASYLPILSSTSATITIDWPEAFKMSPLEDAQTSAQHARSATNFAKAIETMQNLNRGQPGQEPTLDSEGNPIPGSGTEAIPGADLGDLITIDEARHYLGLDKPKVTYDSAEDIK